MRFLVHGKMSEEVAGALRERGHTPVTAAEAGIEPDADAAAVREKARSAQLDVLTGDGELVEGMLPGSGRREVFGRVIVYLQVEPSHHAAAVERLFGRYKRLTPGRLYTVTTGRVKIRQLPAGDT